MPAHAPLQTFITVPADGRVDLDAGCTDRVGRRGRGGVTAGGNRFKTVEMEAGTLPRILDAIQGQALASFADHYRDVTSWTMPDEIVKLARIEV